jgi:eukaryotic-like serine/threonine-protein kinase
MNGSDPPRRSLELITEPSPSSAGAALASKYDALPAGTEIGSYRLQAAMFEGGFSTVYRAVHLPTGKTVAMKVLRPHLVASSLAIERFWREAEAVNRISHPGIVELFECGEVAPGRPFIVMEWLDGRDLGAELRARGRFSALETVAIIEQIGSALDAAHRAGVIHRDLKAENVVVIPEGSWFRVKLLDFGIAKLLDDLADPHSGLTQSGIMLGTPATMAPEQFRGKTAGERTDVYAIGILLYQLLVGKLPFVAANSIELEEMHLHAAPPRASDHVAIPAALEAVMLRCLEKEPARRYASVETVLADLRRSVQSSRREQPAQANRSAIGIYVEIRPVQDGADGEETFDAMEHALDQLIAAADAQGLRVVVEMANGFFSAGALPLEEKEEQEFRKQLMHALLSLQTELALELLPHQLAICLHAGSALLEAQNLRLNLVGELLHFERWAAEHPGTGLFGTAAALAGLEAVFKTSRVGEGSGLYRIRHD